MTSLHPERLVSLTTAVGGRSLLRPILPPLALGLSESELSETVANAAPVSSLRPSILLFPSLPCSREHEPLLLFFFPFHYALFLDD